MAYKIALLGELLIATASSNELLRKRADDELKINGLTVRSSNSDCASERPATFDDLTIIDGITLYKTLDDAEADGAEIVYSGTSTGWLEDDEGRAIYAVAGLKR